MRYRVRHVLLCLAPALFVYAFIVLWAVWLFEAALQSDAGAFLVRSLVGLAVVVTAASALVTYWPTKRRPTRLYHVTTSTVVDAATIEVHPDGTRTVELLGRRPGRPVYFFDRHPRSTSVEFNVWTRPDACIELIDVDYDGIVSVDAGPAPTTSAVCPTSERAFIRCPGTSTNVRRNSDGRGRA